MKREREQSQSPNYYIYLFIQEFEQIWCRNPATICSCNDRRRLPTKPAATEPSKRTVDGSNLVYYKPDHSLMYFTALVKENGQKKG